MKTNAPDLMSTFKSNMTRLSYTDTLLYEIVKQKLNNKFDEMTCLSASHEHMFPRCDSCSYRPYKTDATDEMRRKDIIARTIRCFMINYISSVCEHLIMFSQKFLHVSLTVNVKNIIYEVLFDRFSL